MEINQDLLKLLKGFENQNIIALMHIIKGIITDVEEIEFMKYRLDIKIDLCICLLSLVFPKRRAS